MKRKILPLAIIPFLVLQLPAAAGTPAAAMPRMLHPNHRPCARHADRPGEDPDGFRALGMAPIRRHRPVPEPRYHPPAAARGRQPPGRRHRAAGHHPRRPRGHPPLPRMRQPPEPPAPRRGRGRRTAGPALPLGHSPRSAPIPPQITHYPGLRLADQPGDGNGVINFGWFNSDKKKK